MSLDNLLYAARAGDAKAKRRLFKELRRELVGYFRRRVPAADVEDLTQRTLEIVIKELSSFEARGPGTFRSFVFKTALNQVRRRENLQGEHPRDYAKAAGIEPGSVRGRVRRAILAVREVLEARSESRGPTPKPG